MRILAVMITILHFTLVGSLALAAKSKAKKAPVVENVTIEVPKSDIHIDNLSGFEQKQPFESSLELAAALRNSSRLPSLIFLNEQVDTKLSGLEYGVFAARQSPNLFVRSLGITYQQVLRSFRSKSGSPLVLGGTQSGRLVSLSLGIKKDFQTILKSGGFHPMLGVAVRPLWLMMDDSSLAESSEYTGYAIVPSMACSYEAGFSQLMAYRFGFQLESFIGKLQDVKVNEWSLGIFIQKDWGVL